MNDPHGPRFSLQPLRTLREGTLIAVDSLRINWLRSSLTILGVAVGVSVVVTMAALITGISSSVMSAFESAGPDNFVVTRFDFTAVRLAEGNRPPWWDKPDLTAREATRIAALPAVAEALYNFSFSVRATFEGRSVTNVQSQGYSAGWQRYSPGRFLAGRDFTDLEVANARGVMVISAALAEEMFGQRDPIGRRVRIGAGRRNVQEDFTVIGVFEPEDNVFSAVVRHWVVFPYTTALKRLKVSDEQAQILVVPHDSVTQQQAQDQVIGLMRAMRGLRPRQENGFALLASAQIIDLFNRLTGVFFLVMLALSSAALMVGGVGVIGIMLISVTERTREIGVRRALGATQREILWQFLVEASFLTVLGAAVGMILGSGTAFGVAHFTPIPARIPLWSVIVALAMAALTGMLFGLIPAHRASRLEPVTALRAE